jgi:3-methylfumaryl-CoA hydratase
MTSDSCQHDIVSAAAVTRWCATLNAGMSDSTLAPQSYHWCLCLPEAPTARLGPDGHPPRDDADASTLPRRMWAASSVEFLSPLPVGAAVERRSRVVEIKDKSGSSGRLKFVDVEHLTLAAGREAVRERQTIVYREAPRDAQAMPLATADEPDLSAWSWRRTVVPDEALLFRYSALTFNTHRIHYDHPYATHTEGYPALVVHSPLMATLLVDLCRRQLGDQPLAAFSFRGVAPAFAGDALHLVGRSEGDSIALAALGADGRTVVSATARARQ